MSIRRHQLSNHLGSRDSASHVGPLPSYVEKPRFFAGVRAGASGAVGRDAQDAATSGPRAVISLSGHIPVPHRRWMWAA